MSSFYVRRRKLRRQGVKIKQYKDNPTNEAPIQIQESQPEDSGK